MLWETSVRLLCLVALYAHIRTQVSRDPETLGEPYTPCKPARSLLLAEVARANSCVLGALHHESQHTSVPLAQGTMLILTQALLTPHVALVRSSSLSCLFMHA